MLSNDNECRKAAGLDFPKSTLYQFFLVLYSYENKHLSSFKCLLSVKLTLLERLKFSGRLLDHLRLGA